MFICLVINRWYGIIINDAKTMEELFMRLNYRGREYEVLASNRAESRLELLEDIIDKFIIIDDKTEYQAALFKDDKAHDVFKYKLDGNTYYIKKYENLKFKKKVKNLFRPAEGERYLKLLNKLQEIGVPTIKKGWAIKYGSFINRESLFITEKISGQELIDFLDDSDDVKLREKAIENLSRLLNTLYINKLLSGDPNFSNFFVDEVGEIKFIDMDSIKKFPAMSQRIIDKNLAKLLALAYVHEVELSLSEKRVLVNKTLKEKKFQDILKLAKEKLDYWNHNKIIQKNSELVNI